MVDPNNVEKLHGNTKEHLGTLYDRLYKVIDEYAEQVKDKEDRVVTNSEIVGTLALIQHVIMKGD